MLKVNIITGTPSRERFLRQLDRTKFNEFEFCENSIEDIIWDFVIVYEELSLPQKIKFKKGGLIFISGEPPMSRVYSNKFLAQFDHLITSHPRLRHKNNHVTQQALDWHYGFDFINKVYTKDFSELNKQKVFGKKKKISVISSNKGLMSGHRKRFNFVEKLKNDFGNQISFYGKGINPINDKADAIDPYKFHICIENTSVNDYWSEKLADSFLGFAVPVYFGCKNIDKYFDDKSMIKIDIENYEQSKIVISSIIDNCDELYQNHFAQLVKARNRLLDKYNIFNMLVEFYQDNIVLEDVIINKKIYPVQYFKGYKINLYWLRLKRLMSKLLNK